MKVKAKEVILVPKTARTFTLIPGQLGAVPTAIRDRIIALNVGTYTICLGDTRKKFEPWKVLQALDQDLRCGNFSTVEIMRQVGGSKKYERVIFHGKGTMSRVTKESETHTEDFVPYSWYMSKTGHRNIVFDNEAVLRDCLDAMDLTEKAEKQSISICFTLDYAEVCSTTKRGHVLAGMKIIVTDSDSQEIRLLDVAIKLHFHLVFRFRCSWHIIDRG